MHGPVKTLPPDPPAPAPGSGGPVPPAPAGERMPAAPDREQLRDALHLVLNVSVYDCAGRAVTVKDMLRGSLATQVRMALDGRRAG